MASDRLVVGLWRPVNGLPADVLTLVVLVGEGDLYWGTQGVQGRYSSLMNTAYTYLAHGVTDIP